MCTNLRKTDNKYNLPANIINRDNIKQLSENKKPQIPDFLEVVGDVFIHILYKITKFSQLGIKYKKRLG